MDTITQARPELRQFLSHCRHERNLAENTILAYRSDLEQFLTYLGERDLLGATESQITRHLSRLSSLGGVSPSTYNRHLASIQSFYRFHGKKVADPIECAKLPDALPRPLPKEFVSRMIERTVDPMERTLLELLYGAGLRASEVGSYEVRGDVLRVMGKGSREREIPCPSYLRQKFIDAAPVLRGWSRFKVFYVVKKAGARAGIEDVSPHQLRHSFATHMLQGGADVRVVQELLGHLYLDTTQIYTRLDVSHLKETIRDHHPRP